MIGRAGQHFASSSNRFIMSCYTSLPLVNGNQSTFYSVEEMQVGFFTNYQFRLPYFLIKFSRKLFFFEFGNLKVTVHKGAETIQGRKLYEEIGIYFLTIVFSSENTNFIQYGTNLNHCFLRLLQT